MNHRVIDVSNEASHSLRDQACPTLVWIGISDLVIDDSYQRPLNRSNWTAIRNIAKNFQWNRFAPILVAPVEGGKFAIVDGQHRIHAAAICGIESVPAMTTAMSQSEQASAFSWVNGAVTKISVFHVYKAALVAREQWAIECKGVVEASGCRLMTSYAASSQKKPGEIFCLGLISDHVEKGRGQMVTKGLAAVLNSDSEQNPRLYTSRILRPWFGALAQEPTLCALDLNDFCAEVDLAKTIDGVDIIRKQPDYLGKTSFEIAKIILIGLMKKHFRMAAAIK